VRRAVSALAIVAACALGVGAVTACSGATAKTTGDKRRPAADPAAARTRHPPRYYLSLGDSLSQGVQPDAAGINLPTSHGYADQLYALLRRSQPWLRLVKLGCSGETTTTMIHGGRCRYPAGSQLAAAVDFLRAHRGQVSLITIDIGANDPNSCVLGTPISKILSCLGNRLGGTEANLATILQRLRAAAGSRVTIIGMSYYVPELVAWFAGLPGQMIAEASVRLAATFNGLLEGVYQRYHVRVANVFGAFHSDDFGGHVRLRRFGTVPRNVATVCRWTWVCAAIPHAPDQHANAVGYGVIARAFLAAYRA
jgi:lysophospholipase L1-like esterase